jgi:hypothetical protein
MTKNNKSLFISQANVPYSCITFALMAVSPLLSAFWRVRGRSIGHTIRLYAHLAFLAAERAWIEVLPKKSRHLAMIDRWKRIFWWAQSEKVYIRALGGYYSLIFYLQRLGGILM